MSSRAESMPVTEPVIFQNRCTDRRIEYEKRCIRELSRWDEYHKSVIHSYDEHAIRFARISIRNLIRPAVTEAPYPPLSWSILHWRIGLLHLLFQPDTDRIIRLNKYTCGTPNSFQAKSTILKPEVKHFKISKRFEKTTGSYHRNYFHYLRFWLCLDVLKRLPCAVDET